MSTASILGFTGACPDAITAGYPLGNGYRWFLPALMRFNAPDDFSPFGAGGINPYAYCADDPINRSDPSGHMLSGGVENAEEAALAAERDVAAAKPATISMTQSSESDSKAAVEQVNAEFGEQFALANERVALTARLRSYESLINKYESDTRISEFNRGNVRWNAASEAMSLAETDIAPSRKKQYADIAIAHMSKAKSFYTGAEDIAAAQDYLDQYIEAKNTIEASFRAKIPDYKKDVPLSRRPPTRESRITITEKPKKTLNKPTDAPNKFIVAQTQPPTLRRLGRRLLSDDSFYGVP